MGGLYDFQYPRLKTYVMVSEAFRSGLKHDLEGFCVGFAMRRNGNIRCKDKYRKSWFWRGGERADEGSSGGT